MSLFPTLQDYIKTLQQPPAVQRVGPLGLQLIEYFEGLRLTAYYDTSGIISIGYGHTGGVTPGETITFDQAVTFLSEDLATAENTVLSNVSARLTQTQFDAIVSFVYNIGSGNFLTSSVYNDLQRFNFTTIPYDLSLWNRSGGRVSEGLVTRRHAEAVLFTTGTLDLAPVSVPDAMLV
jgi:lysozyme